MNSLIHPKHGDKANSPWLEEFPAKQNMADLTHIAGVYEYLRLSRAESTF